MKTALIALILAAGYAPTAFAQTELPAEGTPTTLAALLDSGYEVRAVTQLSVDDQKAMWPKDSTIVAMSLIVLQKGPSIASCLLGTGSLSNASPKRLAEQSCHKR